MDDFLPFLSGTRHMTSGLIAIVVVAPTLDNREDNQLYLKINFRHRNPSQSHTWDLIQISSELDSDFRWAQNLSLF